MALVLGACTQDSPTETGSGLLPPDAIRTFEIVLGPERYLQWDTAFGLYTEPANMEYTLLANAYDGVVDSRILLRYQIPRTIVVRDATGATVTDSMPFFTDGTIRFVIDTIASTPPPASIQLLRTTQDWDRVSANWQLRVDTGTTQIPWTVPGGSPGALISGVNWDAAVDTVQLPVDSATIALWRDTTDATRGALVHVATPGTRLRTSLPVLRLRARSTLAPDTVVELSVAPGRTFIFQPGQPAAASTPRVGGTPAWRTVLRLRDRLDTVVVACPGVPNCNVQLGRALINRASFVLQPVQAPPGFAPELPLSVSLHALLPSPLLPLQRSPVTPAWGVTQTAIPTSSFMAPDAPAVDLTATEFVRILFSTPDETGDFRPTHIALLPAGLSRTFGFGTFAALPSLRLIVTTAMELQLP